VVLDNLERVEAELHPDHSLRVCIAGSERDVTAQIAAKYGARYVEVPNRPLGAKVNAAVALCKDCDGVVGIGSDDLVSVELFRFWAQLLATGVQFMGIKDIYCFDLAERQLVHWPGYTNHRVGETVGVGRCHSPSLLEQLDWAPFGEENNCNLDGSMMIKLKQCEYRSHAVFSEQAGITVVDVKTSEGLGPMPDGIPVENGLPWLEARFGTALIKKLLRVPV
jgi:hypothetical protein